MMPFTEDEIRAIYAADSLDEMIAKELHAIRLKMQFGVLKRPQDSYIWPSLVKAAAEIGVDLTVMEA
jgi:hypothetical protein